jgi:hypothetical protein
VAPGCALVAEAVTAMAAAGLAVVLVVGVGVGVADVVPLAEGVGVAELVALVVLGVLLAVADGDVLALTAAADGEADGEAEGDALALTLAEPEEDGVADGDGDDDGDVAAMAVTPLVRTKRPVARPTVTGLECADRMRTPCLSWLSRLENVLSGLLCAYGVSRCLSVEDAPIRHQYRHPMPPLRHKSPQFASASSLSVTSARAAEPVVPRPNSPTLSLPRSVPLYARLSKRKPACPHLNQFLTWAS